MLLRLFKSNHPSVLLLIPLVAAVMWVNQWLPVNNNVIILPVESFPAPLYQVLLNWQISDLWSVFLAFTLLLTQSFLLIRFNRTHEIISERATLPAILFVVISSALIGLHRLQPVLIANIFLILAVYRAFQSFKERNALNYFFDAGFLLSMGSLFYSNLLFYAFTLFISLVVLRQFYWREWLMLILGAVMPYLLLASFYFLLNKSLITIYDNFLILTYGVSDLKVIFHNIHFSFYPLYAFLIALIIRAIGFTIVSESMLISTRKYNMILFWFLINSIAVIFVNTSSVELLMLIALPASFMISHFWFNLQSRWWRGGIIVALILSILFGQIGYIFYS